MAGDWIKMRGNLWDDPRVARLVDITNTSEATVIGGLYWLWASADQHSTDGRMAGLTMRQVNRKSGIKGFAEALESIGWLRDDPDGVIVSKFHEHNGESAKERAEGQKRKANWRSKKGQPSEEKRDTSPPTGGTSVPESSGQVRDKSEAREEKRREEPLETPSQEERGERLGARPLSLPAHWSPSEQDREWAEQERPDLAGDPLIAMTLKFREHHRKKGSLRHDWDETWREWVRREGKARPPPDAGSKADKRAKWASELTGKDHGERTIDGTAERVG